jgi:hypothetical protein
MDEIFKEAYRIFSELIGSGMYIMPPDNNFLFYEQYDFSELIKHRDSQTLLIGQFEPPRPDGKPHISGYSCANNLEFKIDFGDSAHKTGILAFCNSEIDKQHLPQYEVQSGIMVRHPSQPPWNWWKNCSRDQLLAYSAGCWRAKQYDIVKRLLDQHEKRINALGFPSCQNSDDNCPQTEKFIEGTNIPLGGDILDPTHIMFLRICSGDSNAYLDPLAQFALQIAIEATDKDVTLEKNQLILQAIVCGRLDLYVQVHDNYKENIRYYWKSKRQAQIGEAFIRVIEQELKRYSGQLHTSILGLPIETIKSLFNINFKELFNGNLVELENYINRIFVAFGSDMQKIGKEIETYVSNALKNPLSILNIPFMPFNPISKLINNLFNGTDLTEVYSRLNEIQKGILELKNLSEKIIQEIAQLPGKTAEEVEKKLYIGEIDITIQSFNVNSKGFADEVNKSGIQKAREFYSPWLNPLIIKFLENIIRYKKYEIEYAALPNVINCMAMHISCISMAGGPRSLIKSTLEEVYKPWIKRVVDDTSPNSLTQKIDFLKAEQEKNIHYVRSLYNLTFTVDSEHGIYFYRDVPDETPPPGMQPKFVPGKPVYFFTGGSTNYGISGKVKKNDYVLVELYDDEKINNLKPLVERNILPSYYFPKLVVKKTISEEPFNLVGNTDQQPPVLTTEFVRDEFETHYAINPYTIWSICKQTLNVESDPYPHFFNTNEFITKSGSLLAVGESLINHGLLLSEGKQALERIDEIIN